MVSNIENIRVTDYSSQGTRGHMQDMFATRCQLTSNGKDLLYGYFAVFDGHGGIQAASYAKENLLEHIISRPYFWKDDDDAVKQAIRDGFVSLQDAMRLESEKWPKTKSGYPSTSGTTASVAIIRKDKVYVGHIGNSKVVLGYQDPDDTFWKAKCLTTDHKPDNSEEMARIQKCGGKVKKTCELECVEVSRVVWKRHSLKHVGSVRRSTPQEEIPLLAISRSLGDFWSYNPEHGEFTVSPVPDVSVWEIDRSKDRCLILATDGIWKALSIEQAVTSVLYTEKPHLFPSLKRNSVVAHSEKDCINPSQRLVERALDRCIDDEKQADNMTVLTIVIAPSDPPKVQVQPALGFRASIDTREYREPEVITLDDDDDEDIDVAPKPTRSSKRLKNKKS